jgi:hypothetical protein
MNGIWVAALLGQTHLGLKTDPLCPISVTRLKEPCPFTTVPHGPYNKFPDILKVKKRRNPDVHV